MLCIDWYFHYKNIIGCIRSFLWHWCSAELQDLGNSVCFTLHLLFVLNYRPTEAVFVKRLVDKAARFGGKRGGSSVGFPSKRDSWEVVPRRAAGSNCQARHVARTPALVRSVLRDLLYRRLYQSYGDTICNRIWF